MTGPSNRVAILALALGCSSAPRHLLGPDAPCAAGRSARSYTAVVETADGGSAFEDRAVCLEVRVLAPAEPPVDMVQLSAGGVLFLRSGPFDLPPHRAPRRQWVVPLVGVLQVTVTDGTSRRFGPGDLILATDTAGSGHATLGVDDPPFEVLFVPLSEEVM